MRACKILAPAVMALLMGSALAEDDLPRPWVNANDVVPLLRYYHLSPKDEFALVAKNIQNTTNIFHGRVQVAYINSLANDSKRSLPERIIHRSRLVGEHLRLRENDEAKKIVDELAKALPTLTSLPPDARQMVEKYIYLAQVIYWLREAEQQNCVDRNCSQSCLFPIQRGGVHLRPAAARACQAALEEYLKRTTDRREFLEGVWVYNIIHMTLGTYPEKVPAEYLIEPSLLESEADIGRFENVAGDIGVNPLDLAGSVLPVDFDGDGRLELMTTTADPTDVVKLFKADGTGKYHDEAASSGLGDQYAAFVGIPADYDNDGDQDVVLLRGGWFGPQGRIRKSLMRNDGKGKFTDVTVEAGIADPAFGCQSAAWLDFDNDGDLDLYCASEGIHEPVMMLDQMAKIPGNGWPNQLFRNNGDGTFTDVAVRAGVANFRFCKGVAAGDYDNDGHIDLYVSNHSPNPEFGKNRLYRNNGDGTFTDVAEKLGVVEPIISFSCWFFDYDNDGWLDIFCAPFGSDVVNSVEHYLQIPAGGEMPRLYHNDQGKGFTDVTKRVGLAYPGQVMGASFGDLDNDGYLDIYWGTGNPDFRTLLPNVMFRNDGAKRFQDITASGGFGHLQKGHGIAFADIDDDGDQDVYAQMGGFFPSDRFSNSLFLNPGHGNRFLKVRMIGTKTNRDAIGARIMVTLDSPGDPKEVHWAVGSRASFGNHPSRVELGLGKATAIRDISVWWPSSGEWKSYGAAPLDSMVQITEGEEKWVKLDLQPIDIAGYVKKVRAEDGETEIKGLVPTTPKVAPGRSRLLERLRQIEAPPAQPGAGMAKAAEKPGYGNNPPPKQETKPAPPAKPAKTQAPPAEKTVASKAPAKNMPPAPAGNGAGVKDSAFPWTVQSAGSILELASLDGRRDAFRVSYKSGAQQPDVWKASVLGESHKIEAGDRYRVTFRARADEARSVILMLGQDHPPYRNAGCFQELALAPEWKDFSFEAKIPTADSARWKWFVGKSSAAVEVDGLKIERVK